MKLSDTITEFQGKYRFLSNFYPIDIFDRTSGLIFPTVEHAYQASKERNPKYWAGIHDCQSPGGAKRMGMDAICYKGWKQQRISIMLELLRQKFIQHELRYNLLDTGDAMLVEGNRWGDTFWGVDMRVMEGKNFLGFLLMQVREEMR